jgi:hypothetical protein
MRNFLLLFLLTFILVLLLPFYPSVGETKEHPLPDNEYVLNVMLGMGTDVLPAEALKAIAVTLRTYTAFHGKVLPQGSLEDICASTSAEHGEKVYNAMREAVYSTTGEYITYGGKMNLNIIRNIKEPILERELYKVLKDLGLSVTLESNTREETKKGR